jgi:hypothetical protein
MPINLAGHIMMTLHKLSPGGNRMHKMAILVATLGG